MRKKHLILPSLFALTTAPLVAEQVAVSSSDRAKIMRATKPLQFEANTGQTDPAVRFLSRGPQSTLFLTPSGSTVVVQGEKTGAALRMTLVEAQAASTMEGLDPLPGKVNSFHGNDPAQWRTEIPTYARAAYREVWPGIDLIYHGQQGKLEYDFVLAPGADPKTVRMKFAGAEKIEIDERGDLVLHVGGSSVRHLAPVTYQGDEGTRREIASHYVLHGENEVGFEIAAYDRTRPLTIDPVLWYSTFWGGPGGDDAVHGMATDASGNLYITGRAGSAVFPVESGSFDVTHNGLVDGFVSKFSATNSAAEVPALLYSTFLGGSHADECLDIDVVDNTAYVTGSTRSLDFPTVNAFQPSLRGQKDAFVTVIGPRGLRLSYSTYLGGTESVLEEQAVAISVVNSEIYVAGVTNDAATFPTTANAFMRTNVAIFNPAAFLTRFSANGQSLIYSTLFCADPNLHYCKATGLAVLPSGHAFLTGFANPKFFTTKSPVPGVPPFREGKSFSTTNDAFVAKFDTNAAGNNSLVYSTMLGGDVSDDRATDIVVEPSTGFAIVVGAADGLDFPQKTGTPPQPTLPAGGGFITKFNAAGTGIFFSLVIESSFFGDDVQAVGLDPTGIWMAGTTASTDFPVSSDALQSTYAGGPSDAWLGRIQSFPIFGPGGRVIGSRFGLGYASYFGGSGSDQGLCLAVQGANVHLGGSTTSGAGSGFPLKNSLLPPFTSGQEGFVVKLGRVNQAPVVSVSVQTPSLWPPNGSLVNVGLQVTATDDTDPAPTVRVSVFSDETDVDLPNGGIALPDAVDWAPGTLRLRAERQGAGDGRVYLILVTATDSAGNTGYACRAVTVPHSRSPQAQASAAAQAAAAEAECTGSGGPPEGYVLLSPVAVSGVRR